jgi:RNA polymerase sigma factor (sigma-70 family)
MLEQHPKTTLLLDRWHKGDEEALEELLDSHMGWLSGKVRKILAPGLREKGETLDYVQDSLLAFLKDAPRFQMDSERELESGDGFKALLFCIAKRSLSKSYRKWSTRRREMARERRGTGTTILHLEAHVPGPCTDVMDQECRDWILIGMEFVSPAEQEVLALRHHDALNFPEIGEVLGKGANAARMQYNRAEISLSKVVTKIKSGRLKQVLESQDLIQLDD